VIIGGGGHGLATAYYLAKEHGISNVAVLEKGWLGAAIPGRNTTIVRSNYHLDPNAHFYEFSLKLWERLSQRAQLQRDVQRARRLNLVHSPADVDRRIAAATRCA
jgi:sarcosine oxidase subunit beta